MPLEGMLGLVMVLHHPTKRTEVDVTKNITTAKMPRKNRRCHWKRNAKPNVRKQNWKTAAQWS